MPRKGPAPRRPLQPDPIYRSVLVTQIVNKILQRGKRSTAERIVYGALEIVQEKTGSDDPVATLKKAIENVKPQLEVKSRRVGGATYQVPVEVKPTRSNTLAIRWLVGYARQRREKTMAERLANEILDASNSIGVTLTRQTHRCGHHSVANVDRRVAPRREVGPEDHRPDRWRPGLNQSGPLVVVETGLGIPQEPRRGGGR